MAVFTDHACLKKLRFTSPRVITPFARKLTEGHLCPAATGLPITGLIDKVCITSAKTREYMASFLATA